MRYHHNQATCSHQQEESGAVLLLPGAMEQDPGSLSLDETEQRYYSGLHSLCQTDAGSGTLSSPRVAELLQASRLPPEALHQPVHSRVMRL
ncbi:unnamed protein product [Arctogadus glacialis]